MTKADFTPRSSLMSAPILFQTMARRSAECPYNYSSLFVQKLHAKAMRENCQDSTFKCDQAVVQSAESIMACVGAAEDNATFFGLTPTNFNGNTGYAGVCLALPGVCVCTVCACVRVRDHARAETMRKCAPCEQHANLMQRGS